MKALLVFLSLVIAVSAVSDLEQWISFKKENEKNYKSLREETVRYNIFKNNLRRIEEHNDRYAKGEETYLMGVTQFADLTEEEIEEKFSMPDFELPEANGVFSAVEDTEVASSVDWREKGAVTEVQQQGGCGSCWAFSTTGSLEGQNSIKHNKLIPLSPQELVDCSASYGTQHCRGGWMYDAYRYVKDHGISTLSDYKYDGVQETCKNDSIARADIKVTGYTLIEKNSEALRQAVEKVGPISVTLYHVGIAFYTSGIYTSNSCPDKPTHAVLTVGYGSQNGTDYWIMKNSWGAKWGEKGYFRIVRNNDNVCGIYSHGMYPIIA